MTLMLISSGLLLVAAVTGIILNRKLSKIIDRKNEIILQQQAKEYELLKMTTYVKATVEKRLSPDYCFAVCRTTARGAKLDIKCFYFDPLDSDDVLYKLNCAEELADKLNENP